MYPEPAELGSRGQLLDATRPSSISIRLQQGFRAVTASNYRHRLELKTLVIMLQAQGRSSPIWDGSKMIQKAVTQPWRTARQLPHWPPLRARQQRLKPSTGLPPPLCTQGRQRQGR